MTKWFSLFWGLASLIHWVLYFLQNDPHEQTAALLCLVLCYVSEEK